MRMSAKTMTTYTFQIVFGRQLLPEQMFMFGIFKLFSPLTSTGRESALSVGEQVGA